MDTAKVAGGMAIAALLLLIFMKKAFANVSLS